MAAMPAATTSMTAVTAMHGHVQQWAGEEEEQRQPAQCMDAVLGEEEE